MAADGIVPMEWLGNSLTDLNLIKSVWKLMKERITRQRPRLMA